MKVLKIAILLLIVSMMVNSCFVYKKNLFKGSGDIEKARINAIIDYTNKYNKKYSTFMIYDFENINTDYYCFTISPNLNKWSMDTIFEIGEYHRYFPNDFYIHKNKLFMWVDENKVFNKETINVLHKFNILDSINYKIQIGEISPEQILPEFVIDHGIKDVDYFICKNNISKYKTVKTPWILEADYVPKLKCD